MAKVKITGHASGTGVVTVTAPNTSTDRTITLPDATATIATTTDVAARLPSITDGGNATAITIDASENIGIGVATPTTRLDVVGVISPREATKTFNGGISTEVNSSLINFGMNEGSANRFGGSYTQANQGGMLNFDTRSGQPLFQIYGREAGTASASGTSLLDITADGRGLSQFTAKAWVNFNGTSTLSIQDSHNISSVTDLGTGNYVINLSSALANTEFAPVTGGGYNTDTGINSSSAISIQNLGTGFGNEDRNALYCAVFGD